MMIFSSIQGCTIRFTSLLDESRRNNGLHGGGIQRGLFRNLAFNKEIDLDVGKHLTVHDDGV